jgi:hypothetical protein
VFLVPSGARRLAVLSSTGQQGAKLPQALAEMFVAFWGSPAASVFFVVPDGQEAAARLGRSSRQNL